MEPTLKPVKTEYRLQQVSPAPGAAPDGPSSSGSMDEPRAGPAFPYLTLLRIRGLELVAAARAKATEVAMGAKEKAEYTRSKATEAVMGVKARIEETAMAAKQAAWSAAEPITSRISQTVGIVEEAKVAALAYAAAARSRTLGLAASAREVAESARGTIKEKGGRVWVMETAQAARQVAGEAAVAAKVHVGETYDIAKAKAATGVELTRQRAEEAKEHATEKAKELYTATGELVSQKSFQTTAASAATGAVALGAGGAATGLATGGAIGAAAGLPLALFTFGLSIPVGAAVGGGAGLVVGTATGATAGFAGGAAAGYGIYQKQDDIRGAASQALTKATDGAEFVKGTAYASVGYVKGAAVAARARLMRASTGSTEDMD